jgi:hypothetical protein
MSNNNLSNIEKIQLNSIIKRAEKYDLRFYLGLSKNDDNMRKYAKAARKRASQTFDRFVKDLEFAKRIEAYELWNEVYSHHEVVRQVYKAFKCK